MTGNVINLFGKPNGADSIRSELINKANKKLADEAVIAWQKMLNEKVQQIAKKFGSEAAVYFYAEVCNHELVSAEKQVEEIINVEGVRE